MLLPGVSGLVVNMAVMPAGAFVSESVKSPPVMAALDETVMGLIF